MTLSTTTSSISATSAAAVTTPSAAGTAVSAALTSIFLVPFAALFGRIRFGLLRGAIHRNPVKGTGVTIMTQAFAASGLATFCPAISADDDRNKDNDTKANENVLHDSMLGRRGPQTSAFAHLNGASI